MKGVAVLITCLACAFAVDVNAQGRDPATADALFREARAAMKKGDYESACPKFAESQRLDPAPGTLVGLGECQKKLGKLADALQAFRDALDLLPAGDDRVPKVKEQIGDLEKRTPRLTIKLAPGAPAETKVVRDGVELGPASIGAALPVNPGEHDVRVVAPGHEEARFKIALAEREARSLPVETGKPIPRVSTRPNATQPPAPDKIEPRRTTDGNRTVGLIVVAIGLAAGAFGAVSFYEANVYKQQSDDAKDSGDDKTGKDKYATAERWQTTGIVSVVVGAAAITTGGVLFLSAKPETASVRTLDVRFSATATPGTSRLVLGGSW